MIFSHYFRLLCTIFTFSSPFPRFLLCGCFVAKDNRRAMHKDTVCFLDHFFAIASKNLPPPRTGVYKCDISLGILCYYIFMAKKRSANRKNKYVDPRKVNYRLRQSVRARVLAANDVCAICGRPVDKTLSQYDPMAPEVDEIIPVSRGGSPVDLDNLQLTHRSCNERKGNRMVGDVDISKVENPIPQSRAW